MGLPTRKRGSTSAAKDKDSKGGAANKGKGSNLPGTSSDEDEDDDTVYVSKRPPPPHGKYRALVKGCALIRNRDGERVKDKDGNPLPPKLEFIIDDPAELEKAKKGEPSQHKEVVGELLGTDRIGRQRTAKLCAGLGYPESEWEETAKGLRFPMRELDALKDDKRYWLIECKTSNGSGDKKDVPYTHIESVTPWMPPKDKTSKKKKKQEEIDEPESKAEKVKTEEAPDPSEPESEEETEDEDEPSDEDEDEEGEEGETDEAEDDDIPF